MSCREAPVDRTRACTRWKLESADALMFCVMVWLWYWGVVWSRGGLIVWCGSTVVLRCGAVVLWAFAKKIIIRIELK